MTRLLSAVACVLILTPPVRLAADDQPMPQPRATAPASRTPAPRLPGRIFIDVNGGYQSGDLAFGDTRSEPVFGETSSWSADYTVKSGPAFDIGGGVRLWRNLIANVTYSRFSDTNIAAVAGRVPHPFFFNRDREYAGESIGLRQQEQAIHVGVSWSEPVGRHLEVRAFGGPSFFTLERDMISGVIYTESYPFDTAAFGRAEVERLKENTLGFHVGADVAWMFTRHLGVGGLVRFTRAEASLTSPGSANTFTLDQGGLQVGAGLRLRLGRVGTRRPEPRPVAPPRPQAPAARAPGDRPETPLEGPDTAVSKTEVDVFVRPGAAQPLRTLPAKTRVRVIEARGDWLIVEFLDPQWGTRVGYARRDRFDW